MNKIPIRDLGERTSVDVISELTRVDGRNVVDVGCGDLTFSKQLVELGAKVTAIDPDPIQAERNRAQPVPGVSFFETPGNQIPVSSGSQDAVFFSFSLHHIPAAAVPEVFDEVDRVLNDNGAVFVVEPVDGPLNQIMKLFHDEDQERAEAWKHLETFATRFKQSSAFRYHSYLTYDSWESYAERYSSRTFNTDYSPEDVWNETVQAAFMAAGGPGHRFESPKHAMFLSGIRRQ